VDADESQPLNASVNSSIVLLLRAAEIDRKIAFVDVTVAALGSQIWRGASASKPLDYQAISTSFLRVAKQFFVTFRGRSAGPLSAASLHREDVFGGSAPR
jgi:hypothetical protein